MNSIRLYDLFRYYKGLPHQSAAISELEQELLKADPTLLDRSQPWFKTWSQAGKQDDTPAWFEPARKIVTEFENCKLDAYICPAGIPTIGIGHTGPDVALGQRITQAEADALLLKDLSHFADGVHRLLPGSVYWGANQQAALISFAFNVGLGALETSTLRKRLIAGEPGIIVIPQELPKWAYAGEAVLSGLERRRAAEVALFTGNLPTSKPASPTRLTPGAPFSTLVTPHITYGELCLNEDRRRFITQAQCDIATELCTFLEKARTQFGNKPVIITSGHRPEQVNKQVGGARDSEHLYKPGSGAIDWYIQGVPALTLQDWCVKNWPYSTGLGAKLGFVHTGIREGRPKLMWDYA